MAVASAIALSGAFGAIDALWLTTASRLSVTPSPTRVAIVDAPSQQADAIAALRARLLAIGARRVVDGSSEDAAQCRPELIAGIAIRYPQGDRAGCAPFSALPASDAKRSGLWSPDFGMRSTATIPRLSAGHLDDAVLDASAVRDRIVLIAGPSRPSVYVTPLHATDGPVSAAIFDAWMIESIERGTAIRWVPAAGGCAFALAWALLLCALVAWIPGRGLVWALAATLGVFVCDLAILGLAHTFVPVSPALGALVAVAAIEINRRRQTLRARLKALEFTLKQAAQSNDRGAWHATFSQDKPLWPQLNAIAMAHFAPVRSALLAIEAGGARLRLADAQPADRTAFRDQRRDLRASPYDVALTQGRPVALSEAFFDLDRKTVQSAAPATPTTTLLAPLQHAGETYGFWAMELHVDAATSLERLQDEMARYASAFARNLHRERHAAPRDPEPLPGAPQLASLGDDVAQQIAAYRDLYVAYPHAGALIDLEGNIELSTPSLSRLANLIDRPLLSMTLPEMLVALCGLTDAQARAEIRAMLIERRTLAKRVTLPESSVPMYLRAKPVIRGAARLTRAYESGAHLDVLGIQVELAAMQTESRRASFDAESERLLSEAARHIEEARLSLRRSNAPATQTAAVQLEAAHAPLSDLLRRLAAERRASTSPAEQCDIRALLNTVLHDAYAQLSENRLSCRIDGAERMEIAVNGEFAQTLLANSLAVLVGDAEPDSELQCELTQTADIAVLRMRNAGYGVPDWHLDHAETLALAGDTVDPVARLLAHASLVRDRHGAIDVESTLGEGYTIRIAFPVAG